VEEASRQVVNLSQTRITKEQKMILSKGLQFIPTPNKKMEYNLDRDFTEFHRRVRLRLKFGKSDFKPNPNEYFFRTGYDPGKLEYYPDVEVCLNHLKQQILSRINKMTLDVPFTPNVTRADLIALRQFCANKEIIVKPADKGAALLIMNIEDYVAEGVKQLSNVKYYKPIPGTIQQNNSELIRRWAQEMLRVGVFTKKLYHHILPPPNPAARTFYMLPKYHKSRDKWPGEFMPPGRPIVTNVSTETSNLSRWLDFWLQPIVRDMYTTKSLVKDTYDFITKLRSVQIPPGAQIKLIAADVQDLYTNIPHNEALQAVREALAPFCPSYGGPPVDDLMTAFRYILTRNDMEFAGRWFLQTRGISMGNNCAPSIANIYMERIDRLIRGYQPLGYWRFIDDILIIWDTRRNDFDAMMSAIKIADRNINFIVTESNTSNTFLDVEVLVKTVDDADDVNGPRSTKIEHKVYFKPTDTHELLHYRSNHPRHVFKGIVKAQFQRFRKICSLDEDYEKACRTLTDVLINRDYPVSLLQQQKRLVDNTWQGDSRTFENNRGNRANGDVLPFILTWHPSLGALPAIIHKSWQELLRDTERESVLPPKLLVAWRNEKALRHKLIRAQLAIDLTQLNGAPSMMAPEGRNSC
jgi:hypothetical protein